MRILRTTWSTSPWAFIFKDTRDDLARARDTTCQVTHSEKKRKGGFKLGFLFFYFVFYEPRGQSFTVGTACVVTDSENISDKRLNGEHYFIKASKLRLIIRSSRGLVCQQQKMFHRVIFLETPPERVR